MILNKRSRLFRGSSFKTVFLYRKLFHYDIRCSIYSAADINYSRRSYGMNIEPFFFLFLLFLGKSGLTCHLQRIKQSDKRK